MEGDQRSSRRARGRKDDPEYVFIPELKVPRLSSHSHIGPRPQPSASALFNKSSKQNDLPPSRAGPKPVPKGYVSLNSHGVMSQYSDSHHRETSGFTLELGLLPSCKRRRSVCTMSLPSQEGVILDPATGNRTAAGKLLTTADTMSSLKLEQPCQLPPHSASDAAAHCLPGAAVRENAAEQLSSHHDGSLECTTAQLNFQPQQAVKPQADSMSFPGAGADVGGQAASDTSSSDKVHLLCGREGGMLQREHQSEQASRIWKPAQKKLPPVGRISKRKGIPHKSTY